MTEPVKTNDSGNQDVTDTTKTVTDTGATVDTSKFTQADWDKIYSDQKLYEHPRFKGLNERANRAKELEAEAKKVQEAKLLDEKKYQELATLKEKEANDWRSKAENATINNAIAIEAQKLGVVDVEAVTKLISRSGIKLGTDDTVSGVAEAVKALVESKPYLIGKGGGNNKTLGGGTNPGKDTTGVPRFKLSQLADAKFYRAHEKEINEAYRLGLIENDTTQRVTQG